MCFVIIKSHSITTIFLCLLGVTILAGERCGSPMIDLVRVYLVRIAETIGVMPLAFLAISIRSFIFLGCMRGRTALFLKI